MKGYAFQPIWFLFHWTLFISSADAIAAEITSTLSRNSLDNSRPDSQLIKNLPSYFCFILFYKRLLSWYRKEQTDAWAFLQAQNTDMSILLTAAAFPCRPREAKVPSNSRDKAFILSLAVFFVPATLLGLPSASILSVMGGHIPSSKQRFFTTSRVFQKEVWC